MKAIKDVKTLAVKAEEKGWFRKKLAFQSITSEDVLDFPEMTERDLKVLFTGIYQLSQAVSYLGGMINEDGQIRLEYVKVLSDVLKLQVQPRHISKKSYGCFVKYEPNTIGISELLEYTCDYANGSRTVGCCSHIAIIVYYLAHAKYLSKILKPAKILSKMIQQNSIVL